MTEKVYPTTWILDVQEDPETGEMYMEFPPELLAAQGWVEGTELVWGVSDTGEVSLKKAS